MSDQRIIESCAQIADDRHGAVGSSIASELRELRRKQVRDANRRMRARRKRGVYRRMISVPGTQFRRLAELEYLARVDNPAAQITALEAFLFDELQASA